MAKDEKEFAEFQEYFKKYQQQFGLNGYKVYFQHEPLDGAFAAISVTGQVATVTLDSKTAKRVKVFKNIQMNAKHEAIHLLLHRLESNGRWRYASEEEINESLEELVYKLEGLIERGD